MECHCYCAVRSILDVHARWTSTAGACHLSERSDCSVWLTVLQTEPAYRVRDEQFRVARLHQLCMRP